MYLVFQRFADEGATSRTWSLSRLGEPKLSLSSLVQTREEFYGPRGKRPPGLWKRVLRAAVKSNGRTGSYYCPDIPPSRLGILLAVPRYVLHLRWETRRFRQTATEHLGRPCLAYTVAGWRRAKDAT
ncbi:hypothetical protein [Streptomyces pseudovenezuelae]|uniref:hypothetical protein n=1 Tax=Streptomyces pseudovenezuelae TaxID=67350 RepID=UPI003714F9C9